MPFYNGLGILEILLTRIRKASNLFAENLVVATTEAKGDDRIEDLCTTLGITCYRGSENDVLSRFIGAAEKHNADKIIRVCADNVFLDLKQLMYLYNRLESCNCDYVSFITSSGTPSIKTHYGFWAEGVTLNALKRVNELTDERLYHEHVTNFIYANPDKFSLDFTPISNTATGIEKYQNLRLTIDTDSDFRVSQEIFRYLTDNNIEITTENIISYLQQHTDLFALMAETIKNNMK